MSTKTKTPTRSDVLLHFAMENDIRGALPQYMAAYPRHRFELLELAYDILFAPEVDWGRPLTAEEQAAVDLAFERFRRRCRELADLGPIRDQPPP